MNEETLDYTKDEPQKEVVDTSAEPEAAAEVAKSKKSPAAAAVEPEVVRVAPASSASSVAGLVRLSSLKFESNAQNSVSVALVQQRLIELGFHDAGSDNRGWLCEGTRKALALYAGLSEDAVAVDDADLINKLFVGVDVIVEE
jgi:hypothetical protein